MADIKQIADIIISAISLPLDQPDGVRKPFVIAIDGPCASGKSTLAEYLRQSLDCPLIKMDHFFLPPELRSQARLAQAGGNIHHERFKSEVIAGLNSGSSFTYRIFDCGSMTYNATAAVPAAPVVIIEGSYSLSPGWRGQIDLAVFLSIGKNLQKQRILERSDYETLKIFQQKWIPLENKYFAEYKICKNADLSFRTD